MSQTPDTRTSAEPNVQDAFLNVVRREQQAGQPAPDGRHGTRSAGQGLRSLRGHPRAGRRRPPGLQARHRVHPRGAPRRRASGRGPDRAAPVPGIHAHVHITVHAACSSSCSTASASASCPTRRLYGDEGSNTLGNIAAQVPLRIPNLNALGISRIVPLAGLPPADRTPGRVRPHGRGLAGQGLGHGPLGADGAPAREGRSRRFPRASRTTRSGSSSAASAAPRSATSWRRARRSSTTSARSTCGRAGRSSTRPPTACSRSPRTRTSFRCRSSTGSARSRTSSSLTAWGSAASSPGRSSGTPGRFRRTANRHDYAILPAADTLLDVLTNAGIPVLAIGKIKDLFAGRGIAASVHTASDERGMDAVERAVADAPAGLVFANLVDFDAMYGHRNDTAGYAANLERFDERLGRLLPMLREGDLLVLTADHGNDPTTPSTDHSREYVPVLACGPRVLAGVDLGDARDLRGPGPDPRRGLRRRPARLRAQFPGGVDGGRTVAAVSSPVRAAWSGRPAKVMEPVLREPEAHEHDSRGPGTARTRDPGAAGRAQRRDTRAGSARSPRTTSGRPSSGTATASSTRRPFAGSSTRRRCSSRRPATTIGRA